MPDDATRRSSPLLYRLDDELIADGSRRLTVVAGALAVVVALAAVGQYLAGPAGWGLQGHVVAFLIVGLSAAIVAVARSSRFQSSLILDLALLYEIAVSLGVSITDTLAYLIGIAGGHEPAQFVTVASLYVPNFACVVLAGVGAHILYAMAREVSEARAALTRRLAAIMFTDMVGFTALMQENENRAKRLRDRHRDAVRRSTEAHGGEIIQFYGDGTLGVFDSAVEAVHAAVEAQRALREDPPIPVRIGLHIGDIDRDAEGVYGDGVNIAARIEGLSVAGGVLISGKVFDEIKNHPDLPATTLGTFTLKNVRRPVRVYAVTASGLVVPDADTFVSRPEG